MRGHFRLARRTLSESLERGADGSSPAIVANALVRAASFALFQGDHEAARPLLERSLEFSRRAGDERGVARALSGIAVSALFARDYEAGRARAEEALAIYRARGDRHASALALEGTGDERHLALTRGSLGLACVRLGDTAAARRSLASALALASGLAAEREAAYALEAAAELAAASGEPERAVRWMGCADAVRERIGSPRSPVEREEQEALMSRLRAALGMDRARALGGEGAAAGLDATVGEALAWLEKEGRGSWVASAASNPVGDTSA
ncbi:MAG: tetratricopeptide repeat protein [Candidatus Eisenbacteria bacterium]|uniref:Tetratricopeptide repeat protein n=1 Tax=Eiseniibacteriota bacterium TaxID=2212470 RepID=A0A538TA87_UNCEI|nr:MAG: tetratricopeptide repeat protein [Candidatus Eisenbacteria bacterium]